MVKFNTPLVSGKLIKRYKRFLADIMLDDGNIVTAHCPNPGSMKGLLLEGQKVWLEKSIKTTSKLSYGWKLIELKEESFVVIDTTIANKVVKEALINKLIPGLESWGMIKSEVRYGENSRLDFMLGDQYGSFCYLEVKSVSLREGTTALFPDSVTVRGAKHLRDLRKIVSEGHRAILFFLVQRSDVSSWGLAYDIDQNYCQAFYEAEISGVEVMAYQSEISTSSIGLGKELVRRF